MKYACGKDGRALRIKKTIRIDHLMNERLKQMAYRSELTQTAILERLLECCYRMTRSDYSESNFYYFCIDFKQRMTGSNENGEDVYDVAYPR